MGYQVELNTLLRPPASFVFSTLSAGSTHRVTLVRERAFPLHLAMLLIDEEWNFYGYAVADTATVSDGSTTVSFRMLTVFTKDERDLYRKKFLEAAALTGEVPSV